MKERRKEERGEKIYILKVKLSHSKCGYAQREHGKGEVNLSFPYKAVSIEMYFMSNFKAFWSSLSMFSFFLTC